MCNLSKCSHTDEHTHSETFTFSAFLTGDGGLLCVSAARRQRRKSAFREGGGGRRSAWGELTLTPNFHFLNQWENIAQCSKPNPPQASLFLFNAPFCFSGTEQKFVGSSAGSDDAAATIYNYYKSRKINPVQNFKSYIPQL